MVPYAALGLGRDGADNIASSRLESWALDVIRLSSGKL